MAEPTHFSFENIPWVDERTEANPAPEKMIKAAEESGAKRKRLARGENGFFSQYTWMPPGFTVPPHSHNFDELFIVIAGGCTMSTGELEKIELSPRDSVSLAGGREYGFTVGPEGLEFMVVRPGAADSSYT